MTEESELAVTTVTFLFTDIEGSTRLWEEQPDAMRAHLARHDALLRVSIHRHHGQVFKTVGDAFYAAFPTPKDAVHAAVEAQRRMLRDLSEVRVRMALHTGQAEARDGDYFGPALNHVARLLAAGHGRQVLLSRVTAEEVEPELPADTRLRLLGHHRLRDIAASEAVFQLEPHDLPSQFPPLNTLGVAFRRGLVRAGSIAGAVVAIMAALALNASLNARRAQIASENARRQLVRLNVATGTRCLDDGDLLGSLPWFVKALDLDHGRQPDEALHRARLAAVLQQCPLPVHIWFHQGVVWHAEFSPDGRRIVTAGEDGEARIWDAATGALAAPPLRHGGTVWHAAFSPDGRRVVTVGDDGAARIWDVATGTPIARPLRQNRSQNHSRQRWCAAFSPDGRCVVTTGSGTARLWDAATGAPRTPAISVEPGVNFVAFSPDGKCFVTAGSPGARVSDATTGKPITPPLLHNRTDVVFAAFSPDGRRLVTSGLDGTARVWDLRTGRPLLHPLQHKGFVRCAVFSSDGRRMVTASDDQTAQVWDARTGAPVGPALSHKDGVLRAAFSPDCLRVATASQDGTARVWDAATGAPVSPPLRHLTGVEGVCFSPDGRRLLTASADGTARLWDLATSVPVLLTLQQRDLVKSVEFSPDGRRIVTAGDDETARVWDTATGAPLTPPLQHFGPVGEARFSPDGRRIVTASADGTACVWDAASGAPATPPLQHEGFLGSAEFSPDGRRIVTSAGRWSTGTRPGATRVWDVESARAVTPPLHPGKQVFHAEFSPEGGRVVTASDDGTARVWDAATGAALTPPLRHSGSVQHAAFSPDGRRIVTASGRFFTAGTSGPPGQVRIWDAATGRPITPAIDPHGSAGYVAVSSDGHRIVIASGRWNLHSYFNWELPCVARVWDGLTGRPVTPPLQHRRDVLDAEFSPDGRYVATASNDLTARVWDTASGEPLTPPLASGDFARRAAWDPDGRRLAVASGNTVRIWAFPLDVRPVADLRRLAELLAGYGIDSAIPNPLQHTAFRKDRDLLYAKYQAGFTASPLQIRAWHMREAEAAVNLQAWPAARFHLTQLLGANPADWEARLARSRVLARLDLWDAAETDAARTSVHGPSEQEFRLERGLLYAEWRDWDQATADFTRAIQLGAVGNVWRWRGLARLGAGDVAGYCQASASLLAQYGRTQNPSEARDLVRACILVPRAVVDFSPAIQLGEKASKGLHKLIVNLESKGYALYRSGQLKRSLRVANLMARRAEMGDPRPWDAWLLLALVHVRLGHTVEARRWLAHEERWATQNEAELSWDDRLQIKLLRREAMQLLSRRRRAAPGASNE